MTMVATPMHDPAAGGARNGGAAQPKGSAPPAGIVDLAIDLDTTALLLDVDGTLLDLAPHPDAVVVPPGLRDHLSTLLAATGGALALVSGRGVDRLDALFAPLRLPLIGSHGAQVRLDPPDPAVTAPALDPALAERLRRIAAAVHGALAEDKRTSFALHYRAAPAEGPALAQAIAEAVAGDAGIEVLAGHFVFEVKPKGIDKGTAVRAAMARPPFAGRRPVFIGDDVTDEFAFHAVSALGGTAIAVGRPRPGAHLVLADPGRVRTLLAGLAEGREHQRRA